MVFLLATFPSGLLREVAAAAVPSLGRILPFEGFGPVLSIVPLSPAAALTPEVEFLLGSFPLGCRLWGLPFERAPLGES